MLMKQVARELAHHTLCANAAAPGIVNAGRAVPQLREDPAYAPRVTKVELPDEPSTLVETAPAAN